jgi:hypothetical protein
MPGPSLARTLATALIQPRTWVIPYVAVWVSVAFLPGPPTDLDIFFWPSAKIALAGHPLMVYSVVNQNGYPNANGPVALIPLTAIGFIARWLGWLDAYNLRRALALGLFSLFLMLMAKEGVAAIERLRGRPVKAGPRLLAYCVLTAAPPIWQSLVGWGHVEQPIEVWLVLVAVRWIDRGWMLRAGMAFGLAMLSRSSAGLMAVPLALASWRRGPPQAARLFGAAAVTGLAGLLPFYLADAPDVIHSLFTYRGNLPVGAGSVWSLATDHGSIAFVKHWDILFVAATAMTLNLWLTTRRGGFTEERLFAGMALTAASFALLSKTVWPYYFFELLVFSTVWAAGRWRPADGLIRLALPPLAVSVLTMVAEIGSTTGMEKQLVAIEGGAMFVMLGLTVIWLARSAGSPSEPFLPSSA